MFIGHHRNPLPKIDSPDFFRNHQREDTDFPPVSKASQVPLVTLRLFLEAPRWPRAAWDGLAGPPGWPQLLRTELSEAPRRLQTTNASLGEASWAALIDECVAI